jgi:Tol biopolymer transport system component
MKKVFLLLIACCSVLNAQILKSYERSGPIPEPRVFAPGVISTGDYDTHAAFSPDGNTLYFVKMAPDLTKWTLFVSYFQSGVWSEPVIAPFSGQYWDADPFFANDGKTLYFISNRPLKAGDPQKDFDIWKIEKKGSGWSDPIHLDAPINSSSSEYYPTLADDGTMFFGSRRSGGKGSSDIYMSKLENGAYRAATNLGEAINTKGNEFEPFIARDESFLIFMATPTESLETADFFVSFNENGTWSNAAKLPPPFNSDVTEFSPKVTADGKYFFFSSTRNRHGITFDKPEGTADMVKRIREWGNGLCDIYQVDFAELQKVLKK